MTKYIGKPTPYQRDELERIGKKTIKPEDRTEREPKPDTRMPFRTKDSAAV